MTDGPAVRAYLTECAEKMHALVVGGTATEMVSRVLADAALAEVQQKYEAMLSLHNDEMHRAEQAEARAKAAEEGRVDAFVAGAKWWEYEKTGATMWQSDQHKAAEVALARYEARTEEGT